MTLKEAVKKVILEKKWTVMTSAIMDFGLYVKDLGIFARKRILARDWEFLITTDKGSKYIFDKELSDLLEEKQGDKIPQYLLTSAQTHTKRAKQIEQDFIKKVNK